MQKSLVSKPDSLLLLEMELLVSLILLEKKCIFVKYSTLVSSWHVMLQSAHNTECQYFAGNKLGDLKYWKIMRNGQSMNESNF